MNLSASLGLTFEMEGDESGYGSFCWWWSEVVKERAAMKERLERCLDSKLGALAAMVVELEDWREWTRADFALKPVEGLLP